MSVVVIITYIVIFVVVIAAAAVAAVVVAADTIIVSFISIITVIWALLLLFATHCQCHFQCCYHHHASGNMTLFACMDCRYYADLIVGLLQDVALQAALHPNLASETSDLAIPPPMFVNNLESQTHCLRGDLLQQRVYQAVVSGWCGCEIHCH